MRYLLDTCVISELIKKSPNDNVMRWIKDQNEDDLFLCVLTIGEIQKGISKLPDSDKKNILQDWLEKNLQSRFNNKIIEINIEVASYWGKIQGDAEKNGKKMPVIDSLIASAAIMNDLIVVTRNDKDIKESGCKTFNPWE